LGLISNIEDGSDMLFRWNLFDSAYLKAERESSLRKVVFQIKDRTMDNVQNSDSYINITSLKTYRKH
jgi:hypothetical protein